MTDTNAMNPENTERKTYSAPLIIVEFDLETSAGGTVIIPTGYNNDSNINPWALP